jgi:putative sterol carrier protein
MAIFPSQEWLYSLEEKLNNDEKYAQVARNWEGDILFVIEPSGAVSDEIRYYMDLWHGKCRDAYVVDGTGDLKPLLTLRALYDNYAKLLTGKMDPMQALLTGKIGVKGNMAVLMRNVPTVLDFVRCCKEITNECM